MENEFHLIDFLFDNAQAYKKNHLLGEQGAGSNDKSNESDSVICKYSIFEYFLQKVRENMQGTMDLFHLHSINRQQIEAKCLIQTELH